MSSANKSVDSGFQRLERLAPLGYFAMGVGWLNTGLKNRGTERMLVIANGSDWTPQPVTLHASHPQRGFEKLPCWFSEDYDHHMGLAVGDLNGNGYDDVVVAVFAGKNQSLSEGGVKVYLGGPTGLNPRPVWIARGFAATGVAIAPLTEGALPDVLVSCLSESGTIQSPSMDRRGHFRGRPRLLVNRSTCGTKVPIFDERIIEHDAARGAGDVTVFDVDQDGHLDVVFAGSRTAVLYGPPHIEDEAPWDSADVWTSEEVHPFSFAAQAFSHPNFPGVQLVASSRGLFSEAQLRGRSLADVAPGILIHAPHRRKRTAALQSLATLDPRRPEVPAGLTVTHDSDARPCLIAGFLDARGRDIRGAPLRIFHSNEEDLSLPFEITDGVPLPGGGLMAGRVAVAPRSEGPTSIAEYHVQTDHAVRRVVTLPWRPTGDLLFVKVETSGGLPVKVSTTRTSDGGTLCFWPPLPPRSHVTVALRTAEEIEIAAASSAAWPPAGASGIWRGSLCRKRTYHIQDSPPDASVRQAG